MHPDEQEDYGMASELQNCFAEAQIAHAEFSEKQNALFATSAAAGRYAVARRSEWRCRSTDAVVCMVWSFVADYPTREEAEVTANERAQEDHEDQYAVVPTVEMEDFRKTGLPDDAFSEWAGARRAEYAFERNLSDRMGQEPTF